MGGHHQFQQCVFAARKDRLEVALECGLERLFLLPLRMLGRERLHLVEGEGELEIHGLLTPEGPVVVEDRNALGGANKLR